MELLTSDILKVHPSQLLEPSMLTSCVAWYQSRNVLGKDTTPPSNNSQLSLWKNLYGIGTDLVQATVANRPLYTTSGGYSNGRGVQISDGSDSLGGTPFGSAFLGNNASAMTWVVAFRLNSTASNRVVAQLHTSAPSQQALLLFLDFNAPRFSLLQLGGSSVNTTIRPVAGQDYFVFVRKSASSNTYEININGRSFSGLINLSGGTNSMLQAGYGNNDIASPSTIQHISLFNARLTDAQLTLLKNYIELS